MASCSALGVVLRLGPSHTPQSLCQALPLLIHLSTQATLWQAATRLLPIKAGRRSAPPLRPPAHSAAIPPL